MSGIAAIGIARFANHRFGERARGNLSAGSRAAVAIAARFRRAPSASANSRRSASVRERLPPASAQEENRRKRSRRLPRRESEPKKFAPEKIWVGQSPPQSERRENRGD